jgi:hypothetical protein
MAHAFDLDGVDTGAWERGEKDSSQGVSNSQAKASFEWFDDEFGEVLIFIVDGDCGFDRLEWIRESDFFDGIGFCDRCHIY